MEPQAATASVADGRCDVWSCTQFPQVSREEVAKALRIPVERVKVNVTLLGGAFGRKAKPRLHRGSCAAIASGWRAGQGNVEAGG